jgi:hypothetical protein
MDGASANGPNVSNAVSSELTSGRDGSTSAHGGSNPTGNGDVVVVDGDADVEVVESLVDGVAVDVEGEVVSEMSTTLDSVPTSVALPSSELQPANSAATATHAQVPDPHLTRVINAPFGSTRGSH